MTALPAARDEHGTLRLQLREPSPKKLGRSCYLRMVVSSSTLKLPGLYRHTDCIVIRISLAHAPNKKGASHGVGAAVANEAQELPPP